MIEKYRKATVTEEIDGIKYTSSKFATTRALTLQSRVAQVLGERGLQAVIVAFSSQANPNIAEIFPALVKIAGGVLQDPDLPRDLTENLKVDKVLPAKAKAGSVHEHFDAHFTGELPHLFKVLGFVLTHNLVGFTLGSHLLDGSRTSEETTEDESSD